MVPRIRFRGQPWDTDDTAGEFLRRAIADPAISRLTVVVAWARFRGLARLRDELGGFRDRGSSRIIVGIDEGGATRPGLHAALRWFSAAYVFHDQSGGTFHPKIYLAEGESKALLLVGSSNATPGGLYFNHEASLEAEFDLPADTDAEALVGVHDYVSRLLDDTEVCLELTEELIEQLVADPRYRVSGHERRSRRTDALLPAGAEEADAEEGGEAAADVQAASIFGASRHSRPAVPGLSEAARAALADLEIKEEEQPAAAAPPAAPPPAQPPVPPAAPPPPPPPGAAPPGPTVVANWSKVMSRADAQQPDRTDTNPTGVLRLSQAGHDIDWRTWFRRVLFGSAPWAATNDTRGNPTETVAIPMHVTVAGIPHGVVNVRVDHAPHRDAGQANVPTILHWGPTLSAILRTTDYHNHTVTIWYMSDGTYRLDIS